MASSPSPHLKMRSVDRTAMMGATDAVVSMPKPSLLCTAALKPTPRDRTKGTVMGPVVTPAVRIRV